MPAFGDDVAAVVKKLELRDLVLIGHSMGGDVIVEAALRVAGPVRGLVRVDTYATLGRPRTPEEIEELLRPPDVDALARYGVEAVLMPGGAHFLMLEDPHRFNRLLARVVAGFTAP